MHAVKNVLLRAVKCLFYVLIFLKTVLYICDWLRFFILAENAI